MSQSTRTTGPWSALIAICICWLTAVACPTSTSELTAQSPTPVSQAPVAHERALVVTNTSYPHSMGYLLNQRGSIRFNETPLSEVLLTISQQWNVNILATIPLQGQVTGSFREATLNEILDLLLSAHGYRYRTHGHTLVIVKHDPLWGSTNIDQPPKHSSVVGASTFASAEPHAASALDRNLLNFNLLNSNLMQFSQSPPDASPLARINSAEPVPMPAARLQVRITAQVYEVSSTELDRLGWMAHDSNELPAESSQSIANSEVTPRLVGRHRLIESAERGWIEKQLSGADWARLLANQELLTFDGQATALDVLTRVQPAGPLGSPMERSEAALMEAGLKLAITPRVIDSQMIELHVVPESQTLVGFNGAGQPILDTQRAEFHAQVNSAQTWMIGRLPRGDLRTALAPSTARFWQKLVALRPRATASEPRELVCLIRPELITSMPTLPAASMSSLPVSTAPTTSLPTTSLPAFGANADTMVQPATLELPQAAAPPTAARAEAQGAPISETAPVAATSVSSTSPAASNYQRSKYDAKSYPLEGPGVYRPSVYTK